MEAVSSIWQRIISSQGISQRQYSEIEEIRQELRDLTEFVRNLNNIVNQDRTKNEAQREILIEKLKNTLLQFENDLLRGKYPNMLKDSQDDDRKSDS
ncbi:MAG: hypothetical protein AAGF83_05695 [Cyanobacteria bacterium P01_G01_bin.67]